tara:strand:- start:261 stop:431 length:171 start_codon:yes stop_codon:yes gene_type:complete
MDIIQLLEEKIIKLKKEEEEFHQSELYDKYDLNDTWRSGRFLGRIEAYKELIKEIK